MENKEKERAKKIKGSSKVAKNVQTSLIPQLIDELKQKGAISLNRLLPIIEKAQNVLSTLSNKIENESTIIKICSPLVIVGDIHGQFYDLVNMFSKFGYPPETKYLFLGDYVDRGRFCLEVMTLLLVLKINYPDSIFLLRGNHEGRVMTTSFNFKTQCEAKFQNQIYELFIDLFTVLPLCALVDKKYFAVHGGLSPKLSTMEDIAKINRFVEIPEQGSLCDLLWSDPLDENHDEWKMNKNRSCSYFYSRNHAMKFLVANSFRMIIRGHEVQMKGYKYQTGANGEPLTLTIFSAPRYCDTYKNKGAVALMNGKSVSIQSFREVEHPFVMSNYHNAFQLSFPVVAAKVTRILSHILRSSKVGKSMKIIPDKEDKEFLNTISRFEFMEEMLSNSVQNIQSLMLNSSQIAEGLIQPNENVSESLLEFLEMRKEKHEEVIFGPKVQKFVRVKAHIIEEDEPLD